MWLVTFCRWTKSEYSPSENLENGQQCAHLRQERRKTSEQNFAHEQRSVRYWIWWQSAFRNWAVGLIFIDLEVKVNLVFYYDLLLSQQYCCCPYVRSQARSSFSIQWSGWAKGQVPPPNQWPAELFCKSKFRLFKIFHPETNNKIFARFILQ